MKNKKQKKYYLHLFGLLVVFTGIFVWLKNRNPESVLVGKDERPGMRVIANPDPLSQDATLKNQPSQDVKIIKVVSKNFSFEPNEIRVKAGDLVKINLSNEQGYHNWVVDEFKAATGKATEGNSSSVEFTADKKGTYQFYSSVFNQREQGMIGKLIVE